MLVWLLTVAAYDFRKRRVPNWLVLVGAAAALVALAVNAQPLGLDWRQALLGGAAGFGFLLLFYVVGIMGAGDVKFAGALGLWVGAQTLVPAWIIASLMAGAHSVLLLALRRWPLFPRLERVLSARPGVMPAGTPPATHVRFVPYAAYLALATLVWMAWGRQS